MRPLQRSFFIDLLHDGRCDPCEGGFAAVVIGIDLIITGGGVCFHVFLLFFCYVLLLSVIVHLVSTGYFLNLLS